MVGFVMGFGWWVMGCGFWVLGDGFWVLGFGFWVGSCRLSVVGCGWWVVSYEVIGLWVENFVLRGLF